MFYGGNTMIEVEIKLHVTDEQASNLKAGAKFISCFSFVDTYYDSVDYKLTTNGLWLRQRDQQFELKLPATKDGSFHLGKNIPMHEITDEKEIMHILGLPQNDSLPIALANAGYSALYRFANMRQTYIKDGFTIDFDRADFGDLVYCLCEVETLVESTDQTERALATLYSFIAQYNISPERAEGKLGYYIRTKKPVHYNAMLNSPKHQV
jgi:adenylate cyclase class IV